MIAVIDYGLGNLRSVAKAVEIVSGSADIIKDPKDIKRAKAIILPGVGAFYQGMNNLNELGFLPFIYDAIKQNVPFLGICLGLQLLFTESEEHGMHKGLDIIKGKVRRFKGNVKIPHMGWNTISLKVKAQNAKLFKDIPDNSYFYFVHSYYVEPIDKTVIAATTDYGIEFVSAIQKDNIFGTQFHLEKSSDSGLKILKNFVDLVK